MSAPCLEQAFATLDICLDAFHREVNAFIPGLVNPHSPVGLRSPLSFSLLQFCNRLNRYSKIISSVFHGLFSFMDVKC
jgi:hypothetical protein